LDYSIDLETTKDFLDSSVDREKDYVRDYVDYLEEYSEDSRFDDKDPEVERAILHSHNGDQEVEWTMIPHNCDWGILIKQACDYFYTFEPRHYKQRG
jgi:hypothetical protein